MPEAEPAGTGPQSADDGAVAGHEVVDADDGQRVKHVQIVMIVVVDLGVRLGQADRGDCRGGREIGSVREMAADVLRSLDVGEECAGVEDQVRPHPPTRSTWRRTSSNVRPLCLATLTMAVSRSCGVTASAIRRTRSALAA